MKFDVHIRSLRRLLRGVAVFFLLVVSTDLTCPQPYCGEIGKLPVESNVFLLASGQTDIVTSQHASITNADDYRQEQPSDSSACEEDCFCCAYVTSGVAFTAVVSLDQKLPGAVRNSDSLPSPPLRSTFHPPRIA